MITVAAISLTSFLAGASSMLLVVLLWAIDEAEADGNN